MRDIPADWSGASAGLMTSGNTAFGALRGAGARRTAIDYLIDRIAPCPWSVAAGSGLPSLFPSVSAPAALRPLYTAEERRRRDATGWTTVQGILAPVQFAVFLVSLVLVLNYLVSGQNYEIATASVLLKTILLYAIMITGSIWEKAVFGKFLFAPAFFWEDVVSMLVIALHTAYVFELIVGVRSPAGMMLLVLVAYASYAVNATQFLLKLRTARLETSRGSAIHLVAGRAQ